MELDLFIQGRPEQKDGQILLSMPHTSWLEVAGHSRTRVIRTLLSKLVGSLEQPTTGILTPAQAAEYLEGVQDEVEAMKRPGVCPNTSSNPMIQENFYLNQVYQILKSAIGKSVKENRDIVLVTDSLEPTRDYTNFGRTQEMNFGFVGIRCARLDWIDAKSNSAHGQIDFVDGLEGSSDDPYWIAKPIPKEVHIQTGGKINTNLPFYVRPDEINCLTNGYHFTLLPDFNKDMVDYVCDTIEAFKTRKP